ncbi:uncharacterized protein LTR77_001984 [Saxophila tyrrhenica]|uniref:Alcohol acetyltransferase n=1 Tax=Saxophila tyrrhenica TaxID=1690608 RepID=A0AAV9PLX5_9PEZI|nr:hypothetical protein LTR77_001984 [Saxophila tyrrhenica]
MNESREIRPLGLLEVYSSSRHSLGFYRCVANTCRYTFRTPAGDVQADFRKGLKDVIQALPALQVGIRDEASTRPVFVLAESVKLSNHLQWRQSSAETPDAQVDDLRKTLEWQHGKEWPDLANRPPWTVICSEYQSRAATGSRESFVDVDVTFAVHHAVADGLSTSVFHSRLLESLNKQLSGGSAGGEKDEAVGQEMTLDSPLEELASIKPSWLFLLRVLWTEFWNDAGPRNPFAAPVKPPWTGAVISTEPQEVNIRLLQFPSEVASGAIVQCKAHNVSLTTLVHGIVAYSFSRQLPTEAAESFVAQTSISFRPYMSGETDSQNLMGTYVTSKHHLIPASTVGAMRSAADDQEQSTAEIWKLASSIKTELDQRLTTLPNDDHVGLLPYVNDWRERWKNMLGKPRDVTWEVSNLGVMSGELGAETGEEASKFEITQTTLTQSANVAGVGFSVNMASMKGGVLSVSLCWQEGVVDAEVMDGVKEDLEVLLKRIGGL